MDDIKNYVERNLEWGEISPEELLRKMYQKRHLSEMKNPELMQMLDDLLSADDI